MKSEQFKIDIAVSTVATDGFDSPVLFCLQVVVICLGCCIHGQRDRVDVKNDLTIDQVILGAMGGTNSKWTH